MDASIASGRDPSPPLRVLALSVGCIAGVSLVVAAGVLMVRWGAGAITPRTGGGFLVIACSAIVLIAAAAAGLWPLRTRLPSAGGLLSAPARGDASPATVTGDGAFTPPPAAALAVSPPRWPEARLVQRIERYERQVPGGAVVDAAVGRVVVRFSEGSRAAVAHVGFCPPFATTPRVAVSNECDGVEVDVVAPEVLPWGVRIECRLEEPAEEPLDVEVELVAEPSDAR